MREGDIVFILYLFVRMHAERKRDTCRTEKGYMQTDTGCMQNESRIPGCPENEVPEDRIARFLGRGLDLTEKNRETGRRDLYGTYICLLV